MPVRFYFPQDFIICAQKALTANECVFFANTCFLLRGEIPLAVYEILEKASCTFPHQFCITPTREAKLIADDKKRTYQHLHSLGFAMPHTLFEDDISLAPNNYTKTFAQLAKSLSLPFIAKPRFGSMGRGVHLITQESDFCRLFDSDICADQEPHNLHNELIFQEFIETRTSQENKPKDVRCFVCGSRVIAAAVRTGEAGGVVTNVHQHGSICSTELPAHLQACACCAVAAAGLDYGTADFLVLAEDAAVHKSIRNQPADAQLIRNRECTPNVEYSERTVHTPLLCEINASPGFEGLEKAGMQTAEPLVSFLLSLL